MLGEERESDEERRQHDPGGDDREAEAETEEEIGAHHEDRAEDHVVGHAADVGRHHRRHEPADVAEDQCSGAGAVEPLGSGLDAIQDLEGQKRADADDEAREYRIEGDIRDQQNVDREKRQIDGNRDPEALPRRRTPASLALHSIECLKLSQMRPVRLLM
ncbi:hypothetical protein D9M72_505510 [compost metagenome]